MCTLIIGRNVLGARTLLLGANRDEDPARPTDPPGVLLESPLVVGGRDRVAGGTWLALRENLAVVALLNRHDRDPAPGERRSRGQLALEVAAAPLPERGAAHAEALDLAARATLKRALARDRFGPFTLVFASAETCWLASSARDPAHSVEVIPPGWHVLTHRNLDDPSEPRAAHLLGALSGFRPRSRQEAETRLIELLRRHGEDGSPPVCIHQGRMQTVSSSLLGLDPAGARYLHAEGRPCERDHADQAALSARAG